MTTPDDDCVNVCLVTHTALGPTLRRDACCLLWLVSVGLNTHLMAREMRNFLTLPPPDIFVPPLALAGASLPLLRCDSSFASGTQLRSLCNAHHRCCCKKWDGDIVQLWLTSTPAKGAESRFTLRL